MPIIEPIETSPEVKPTSTADETAKKLDDLSLNDEATFEECINTNLEPTPEEKKVLLEKSENLKAKGNRLFAEGKYTEAIEVYENALDICPEDYATERAVYFGNMGACFMKLDEYKKAVEMCDRALELNDKYTKALLRRAQANEKLGNLGGLMAALEDYKKLKEISDIPSHQQTCLQAIQRLPPRIQVQQEKEKQEMLGKLKDLGNTILGKFGLSTDNFKLQQDPNTGGYSVNFVSGGSSQQ
ncbi:uncharacterized protein VTP21DRAFT_2122 [Calcarisporiella thermophila]|uniref:uncharacterized protein n=1 Tax=Calcarisporiella thermophila TaxID=911321 RepID=UPI0037449BAC